MVPGSEVAGTVTAVGADADASWLGRRVWAFTHTGGYAEQALAQVGDAVVLADGLSSIEAVTFGSSATVAHFGPAHAHFTSGESVLVRGAAGSIGISAVELSARGGASAVAVTTSSAQRGSRLRDLGATHVLDRSGDGDPNAPESYDMIIDIVGGPARDAVRAELFAAATRGELHAVVHDVLPLDQAAEAHRQMDAGSVFGRIVLVP